ncbi:hypothetical protein WCLP8_1430002 [uncultured Gammaproteobacteria bacterium]
MAFEAFRHVKTAENRHWASLIVFYLLGNVAFSLTRFCGAISVFNRSGSRQTTAQRDYDGPLVGLALPAPLPAPPQMRTVVYRVGCAESFRTALFALAERRGVEIPALITSTLAVVEPIVYGSIADPGDGRNDGTARTVLTLHLSPGFDHRIIRQILATSLALAGNGGFRLVAGGEIAQLRGTVEKLEYRNQALAKTVERLSFAPLSDEVAMTLREAVGILGLGEECYFDEQMITRQFRELAMIYHPDTGLAPSRQRMTQLIDARNLLVHHIRGPRSGGMSL